MNLLTTNDAANRLGVSVGRVYQFISEKRLPAQKLGRDYLIEEKDLKLVEDRKPGRPKKQTATKQLRKK
jgi:excisionase family DNA binding protein